MKDIRTNIKSLSEVARALRQIVAALEDMQDDQGSMISAMTQMIGERNYGVAVENDLTYGVLLLEDGDRLLLEENTPAAETTHDLLLQEDGFPLLMEDGFSFELEETGADASAWDHLVGTHIYLERAAALAPPWAT